MTTEPLGADDLNRSYQRPAQSWVCGWAAEGHPCALGPSPRGQCVARAECRPHRDGDRWRCARAAAHGGPCNEGPLPDGRCSHAIPPCQPVRSLRARRSALSIAATAFSLGVILFLLGGRARPELLSPGDLTFKHGTVTQSCEACHAIAANPLGALFEEARMPLKASIQTGLCLECHDLGPREQSAMPHGLVADELRERTARASRQKGSSGPLLLAAARDVLGPPLDADGALACATCHREHNGRHANLSLMDNQRCQACHQRQFASLADGHPEFDHYPYKRRTAIFFDHESHLGRHFRDFAATAPGGRAPRVCIDCHVLDPAGRMMLVKKFDEICASCHLAQISDTTLGGVRFFDLPGLDVERLAQPPSAVGEWPAAAADDLTPFLTLLIQSDRDAGALAGVNLCDLRGAKLDELREAGELAWKVKELMHDLLTEGDQALRWRLAGLVEPPLSQEQITLLIADLAPSTVRVAQEKWLPGLYQEIAAHRAGAQLPAASPPASIFNQPGSVRWLIDDADCSLQYLPRRHTDLFLQNWLDLAGREYATSPRFARLFDALASPYAPGRCTKCHSVEARPDGSRFVHWKPAAPEENVHAFTTFVHQPHFNLFEGQRCDLCHTLAAGSGYAAGFVEPDNSLNIRADRFSSNFESIARGTCAACHSEEKAGESCLLCHSYHVGTFSAHRTPAEPRPHARRRFGRPGGS